MRLVTLDAGSDNAKAKFTYSMSKYTKSFVTSDPVSWQGARLAALLCEIDHLFGVDFVQCGQLILDVRLVTLDAGSDNAKATFTDSMDTYMKALVTSDPVFHGRVHVQPHFYTKSIIYLGSILSKSGHLILDVMSITLDGFRQR